MPSGLGAVTMIWPSVKALSSAGAPVSAVWACACVSSTNAVVMASIGKSRIKVPHQRAPALCFGDSLYMSIYISWFGGKVGCAMVLS